MEMDDVPTVGGHIQQAISRTMEMTEHQDSACKPECHVWRRDAQKRNSPIAPDLYCACQSIRFMDLADGSEYWTEYLEPDGRVLAGSVGVKRTS
jgi:hypothetical protein